MLPPPPGTQAPTAPPPHGVATDQPTISSPAAARPPDGRSGRTVWIALGVAAAVLLIGGGALLALVLVGSDPDPSVTATDAAVTTSPTTAAPATLPPTTALPATAAPATAAPATAAPPTAPPTTKRAAVPARVTRTCGAGGNGDCFVTFRPSPSSDGADLGTLDEGMSVTLECQQPGESITASELGYPTDVWARSTDGRWLSMAFLDAPGWSLTDVTVPC